MHLPDRSSVPIVGTRRHWATKSAQLGGTLVASSAVLLATFTANADLLFLLRLTGYSAFTALVAMAVGGVVGAMAPGVMDRVRGRVPLWMLAPGQAAVGAGAGAVAGAIGGALLGIASVGVAVGALLGGVAAVSWWLPFTFATVTGGRWPVTATVGIAVPPLVFAALYLLGL